MQAFENSIKNNYFTEAAQIIDNIKGQAHRNELYASLCEVYWRKEDYSRYRTYLDNITDAYKGKDKMSYDLGLKYVDNNMNGVTSIILEIPLFVVLNNNGRTAKWYPRNKLPLSPIKNFAGFWL